MARVNADRECTKCGSDVKVTANSNTLDLECAPCNWFFCGVCGKDSHFPALCKEYDQWADRSGGDGCRNFYKAFARQDLMSEELQSAIEAVKSRLVPENTFEATPLLLDTYNELQRMIRIRHWLEAPAILNSEFRLGIYYSMAKFIESYETLLDRFSIPSPDLTEIAPSRANAVDALVKLLDNVLMARTPVPGLPTGVFTPFHVHGTDEYCMSLRNAIQGWRSSLNPEV